MKNSGLFLNMANGVFWVWFFSRFLILKRFVVGVSGIVSKVLKMLVVFPSFLGFSVIFWFLFFVSCFFVFWFFFLFLFFWRV